jgi:glycosyltransferase involved in cell wall biosynthesis
MIVGKPRGPAAYWSGIEQMLRDIDPARMIQKIEFVPDEDTELYFKAADVLVLPYTEIFQSGVLFLGYSFGLPVIAADVGSMKDDIIEGRTGLVFPKENPEALAAAIESYFASDLYRDPGDRRKDISDFANERHSWETVSRMTVNVYSGLLRNEADSEGLAKATRTREGLQ